MEKAETPKLEFKPGERAYYQEEARRETAGVYDDFEAIRTCLGIHPQAYELVKAFLTELPYNSNNKIDPFVAWRLAVILKECAQRLKEVGIIDVTDLDRRLDLVDLSAAREGPQELSHREIQNIATDGNPEIDQEVAESAGAADDDAIQDSAGVNKVNEAMKDPELQRLEQIGGRIADMDDGEIEEKLKFDDIDPTGTNADPDVCSRKAAAILFSGATMGIESSSGKRPSLFRRMLLLVDYGILKKNTIKSLVFDVQKEANGFIRQRKNN